jgi:hypothetical protein
MGGRELGLAAGGTVGVEVARKIDAIEINCVWQVGDIGVGGYMQGANG